MEALFLISEKFFPSWFLMLHSDSSKNVKILKFKNTIYFNTETKLLYLFFRRDKKYL